jgi:hypothetical protein
VVNTGIPSDSLPPVLDGIARLGWPAALLDEGMWEDPPAQLWGRGRFSLFTLCGRVAGQQVGKHLIALGHRRVVFFSGNAGDFWSRQRLAGLREAFVHAGIADGVADCSFAMGEHLGAARARHHLIGSGAVPAVSRPVREAVAQACGVKHDADGPASDTARAIDVLLSDAAGLAERMPVFRERLRAALADKRATAIVACNDEQAIQCLPILRGMRVDVPDRMAVVGFDDSLQALSFGLTSYDFNLRAVLQEMLERLLDGRRHARARPPQPIEIEGFVVQRRSSPARNTLNV